MGTALATLKYRAHATPTGYRRLEEALRGLNRGILAQGWGQIREFVEYKAAWAGRTFVAVSARNTSITCAECREVNKRSRRTQARFLCVACGHPDHADANAAENIRRQGLELLGRADGHSPSPEDGVPARAQTAGVPGTRSRTQAPPAEPRNKP